MIIEVNQKKFETYESLINEVISLHETLENFPIGK